MKDVVGKQAVSFRELKLKGGCNPKNVYLR